MKVPNHKFSDRLEAQAEAKKALLAKFKPKPAAPDPDFDRREELAAAEREAARLAREAEKEQRRQEQLAKAEAERLKRLAEEEAQLEARRAERKQRKALTKAEQQAAREAKKASRMAGVPGLPSDY